MQANINFVNAAGDLFSAQALVSMYRTWDDAKIATAAMAAHTALEQAIRALSWPREDLRAAIDEIARAEGWVAEMRAGGLDATRVRNITVEIQAAKRHLPGTGLSLPSLPGWAIPAAIATTGVLFVVALFRR